MHLNYAGCLITVFDGSQRILKQWGIKIIPSNCSRNFFTLQPFLKQKLYSSRTQVVLHCASDFYHSAFITTIYAGEFIVKGLIIFKFVLKGTYCFNLRNKTFKKC
jgi:hypothetical protein